MSHVDFTHLNLNVLPVGQGLQLEAARGWGELKGEGGGRGRRPQLGRPHQRVHVGQCVGGGEVREGGRLHPWGQGLAPVAHQHLGLALSMDQGGRQGYQQGDHTEHPHGLLVSQHTSLSTS